VLPGRSDGPGAGVKTSRMPRRVHVLLRSMAANRLRALDKPICQHNVTSSVKRVSLRLRAISYDHLPMTKPTRPGLVPPRMMAILSIAQP